MKMFIKLVEKNIQNELYEQLIKIRNENLVFDAQGSNYRSKLNLCISIKAKGANIQVLIPSELVLANKRNTAMVSLFCKPYKLLTISTFLGIFVGSGLFWVQTSTAASLLFFTLTVLFSFLYFYSKTLKAAETYLKNILRISNENSLL